MGSFWYLLLLSLLEMKIRLKKKKKEPLVSVMLLVYVPLYIVTSVKKALSGFQFVYNCLMEFLTWLLAIFEGFLRV